MCMWHIALKKMSRVHRDVTMLTDAREFCSIPAKELKVVVRGYTIRISNMTWLRRVGAVCGTPESGRMPQLQEPFEKNSSLWCTLP